MESVYAIYIGTTKIVGIKGTLDKETGAVVETLVKVSALGFEKGIVVDLERASSQIKEVVTKIAPENQWNKIRFYVVLSNSLIRMFSFNSSVFFGETPKVVTQPDVERVIQQTRGTATIPLAESIILTLPQEFIINDLGGIQNPLDLEARRLAVNLLLFTVHSDAFKNINKVFDRLELNCEVFLPRIVTSSYSVLRAEEKRNGIALIDVGGHNTTLSYFYNQILHGYDVLPEGAEIISESLAKNFSISVPEARKLKEQYGSTIFLERFEDEIVPVVDIFGKTKFNINKKRLYDQIHLSAGELTSKIKQALQKSKEQGHSVCGVVVTGGGARLDGFLEMLEKELAMTVRLGVARNISGHTDAVTNPAYASQLGLLGYLSEQTHLRKLQYQGKGFFKRNFLRLREWIQDNF